MLRVHLALAVLALFNIDINKLLGMVLRLFLRLDSTPLPIMLIILKLMILCYIKLYFSRFFSTDLMFFGRIVIQCTTT